MRAALLVLLLALPARAVEAPQSWLDGCKRDVIACERDRDVCAASLTTVRVVLASSDAALATAQSRPTWSVAAALGGAGVLAGLVLGVLIGGR